MQKALHGPLVPPGLRLLLAQLQLLQVPHGHRPGLLHVSSLLGMGAPLLDCHALRHAQVGWRAWLAGCHALRAELVSCGARETRHRCWLHARPHSWLTAGRGRATRPTWRSCGLSLGLGLRLSCLGRRCSLQVCRQHAYLCQEAIISRTCVPHLCLRLAGGVKFDIPL